MSYRDSEYEGDEHVQHHRDVLSPSLFKDLWAYIEVTKPASVLLLLFTALATMVVAAGGWNFSFRLLVTTFVAVTLGCAGANTITCYIDRDMDQVMERTKRRPIPSGRIHPPQRALYWGILLTVSSLILAWTINPLTFVLGFLGWADNVLVYSLLMKRRSPLNVILGGFSGGLPALVGWAAVQNSLNLTSLLIASIVVLWIPNHIWNLAIVYTEDYKKVSVPMLPAVFSLEKTIRCTVATVVLMYVFSLALYSVGGFGFIYLGIALVFGLVMTVSNVILSLRPSRERAWIMFKLSSPYLFVLFLAMILDVLLL
jgi:protoheme IX farnesyltransferase